MEAAKTMRAVKLIVNVMKPALGIEFSRFDKYKHEQAKLKHMSLNEKRQRQVEMAAEKKEGEVMFAEDAFALKIRKFLTCDSTKLEYIQSIFKKLCKANGKLHNLQGIATAGGRCAWRFKGKRQNPFGSARGHQLYKSDNEGGRADTAIFFSLHRGHGRACEQRADQGNLEDNTRFIIERAWDMAPKIDRHSRVYDILAYRGRKCKQRGNKTTSTLDAARWT